MAVSSEVRFGMGHDGTGRMWHHRRQTILHLPRTNPLDQQLAGRHPALAARQDVGGIVIVQRYRLEWRLKPGGNYASTISSDRNWTVFDKWHKSTSKSACNQTIRSIKRSCTGKLWQFRILEL